MAYKNKEDKKNYMKQYYINNEEEIKKNNKRWRKDNFKEKKEYNKRWRKDNKERKRRNHLNCKYGLSLEDWLKMWKKQSGKCLICGTKFTKPSDANVDHNHKTGKIRGLLCYKCNFGLGNFNDNPKTMIKAIEYLLGED